MRVILGLSALAVGGCQREADQPWRKALDEGKVVRLDGTIGKLDPGPLRAPTPGPTPAGTTTPVNPNAPPSRTSTQDPLPIPPPPKAVQKGAAKAGSDEDGVSLGSPQ